MFNTIPLPPYNIWPLLIKDLGWWGLGKKLVIISTYEFRDHLREVDQILDVGLVHAHLLELLVDEVELRALLVVVEDVLQLGELCLVHGTDDFLDFLQVDM